jgi:Pectate lyase superfamily protein
MRNVFVLQLLLVILSSLSSAAYAQTNTTTVATLNDTSISVKDIGAKGDGVTDDTLAFVNWWNQVVSTGKPGYIPQGRYIITQGLFWNVEPAASAGVKIYGDGAKRSVLVINNYLGIGCPAQCNAFYSSFSDFGIQAYGVILGVDNIWGNGVDALNGYEFRNLDIEGAGSAIGAPAALWVNGVYSSNFSNVSVNYHGSGDALLLNKAAFNTFQGAFGQAHRGVHLTQIYSGDAVYGNVFLNLDLETDDYDVVIDSPNAATNTFVGGQYAWFNGAAIDAPAGVSNIFLNPNWAPSEGYPQSPLTKNTTGINIHAPRYGMTTPPLPKSGIGYVNSTGQTAMVTIYGGAVSEVCINATCLAPISGGSFLLPPGDTIGLQYTNTPGWLWMPVN